MNIQIVNFSLVYFLDFPHSLKNSKVEAEQDYNVASNFDELDDYPENNVIEEEESLEDEYENSKLQDEHDSEPISDDDLEKVLSSLTKQELSALASSLVGSDDGISGLSKRELPGWTGKNADVSGYRKEKHNSNEDDYEEVHQKIHSSKHCPANCRSGICGEHKRFLSSSPDKKIQAKISYLMEKDKQNYESPALENTKRFYNGRLVRNKRGVLDENSQSRESADDPRSPEHIKLLEESFPNPSEESFLKSDDSLVRVKRDNL